MHSAQPAIPSPKQTMDLLRRHVRLWLVPALLIAAAASVYAVVHQPAWEASQALIVRNEASGAEKSPGKFNYPEEMKSLQETLLELAKSRGALRAALGEVGPPADSSEPGAWPTERDIVEARKNVKLVPPKGAEFGSTEVFYLNVRAEERARSVALNQAIFKQIQSQFQQLRDAKARSVMEELEKTVSLAKADLAEATAALAATERAAGSDLAELRSMQEMASSDSALRRSAEDIRAQMRENDHAEKINQEWRAVLEKAREEPGRLVAAPNRLLDAHPSLRRLKEGLIDAQIRTAALQGNMAADHPRVRAAKEAEEEIGRHLRNELAIARRSVEVDLRLNATRRILLDRQLTKTNERLSGLAAVRAAYTNQIAEAKNRSVLLERAEQNLAEARASLAGAKAATLISRIDLPDAGIRPVGPGRITIVLCGVLGGLMAGLGVLFLVTPGHPATAAAAPTVLTANGCTVGYVLGYNGAAEAVHRVNGYGHLSINHALHKLAR